MNDSTFQKEMLRIQAAQARALNTIGSTLAWLVKIQEDKDNDKDIWMNRALRSTGDFQTYCRSKDLSQTDPVSLETFKNWIIDHGGNLEDCE